MQEMVNYLLGLPEYYCTHHFRALYYANVCSEAEALLPQSSAVGDRSNALAPTFNLRVRPEPMPEEEMPGEDEPDAAGDAVQAGVVVSLPTQRLDYEKRAKLWSPGLCISMSLLSVGCRSKKNESRQRVHF